MSKHILLVDDDTSLRLSIESYLSSEGFTVKSFKDVKSALKFLYHNKKPDMIITDIMMANLNGYDFITILRGNIAFSNIPIIFLTAKGMTSDRIKGYNLGCNAYISKPFDPNELVSIVNSLFSNMNILQNSMSFAKNTEAKSNSISDINFQFTSSKLTPRESSVFKLVIRGLMNKEIAAHLNLSLRNVEKYVSRLLKKTNTRNRTELAKAAWNRGQMFSEGE
uniref:hypothetical protein n=1 Tax=Ahnfeltia fastigiata TaxID=31363 RepID=UPI001D125092|nr:hypothetical protein LK038_pgp118 [Ahnfeltia fastigiata]UAT97592.1 hypothetical protein Ahn.fas.Ore.pt_112 [Ahnfeltia fastigiata]